MLKRKSRSPPTSSSLLFSLFSLLDRSMSRMAPFFGIQLYYCIFANRYINNFSLAKSYLKQEFGVKCSISYFAWTVCIAGFLYAEFWVSVYLCESLFCVLFHFLVNFIFSWTVFFWIAIRNCNACLHRQMWSLCWGNRRKPRLLI